MVTKQQLMDFEATVAKLWEDGKIRVPVHLSGGNEDQLINIFEGVHCDDFVFSTHRNHYHYLLHGGSADKLLEEIKGSTKGICKGNSGSMHTIDTSINFYSSAIVGGMPAIAVGVAWALKDTGSNRACWCFIGDGALDEGHTHEAIRYAKCRMLPITFVIENNNRSTCTSIDERWGDGEDHIIHEIDIWDTGKVIAYDYDAAYPHVGTGKYVQF